MMPRRRGGPLGHAAASLQPAERMLLHRLICSKISLYGNACCGHHRSCWPLTGLVRLCRLLQEYTARQAAEGELSSEELPADVLSAVEQSATAETRHFASFAAAVANAPEQVRGGFTVSCELHICMTDHSTALRCRTMFADCCKGVRDQ